VTLLQTSMILLRRSPLVMAPSMYWFWDGDDSRSASFTKRLLLLRHHHVVDADGNAGPRGRSRIPDP